MEALTLDTFHQKLLEEQQTGLVLFLKTAAQSVRNCILLLKKLNRDIQKNHSDFTM